ncbi:hypothetical protein N7499_000595 [Penicillium canescens]|uniref:GST N-terminal domain-containing protein n=1 Tax=Penicillium canescens TaxID=5083 RepID=A0AAD6IH55_PENCN|nr:hypothetical protein N7460_004025 [Penicillium canescens]KAJ6100965.1 hypothetical protein N7499_000595 [Penicillium canescens]
MATQTPDYHLIGLYTRYSSWTARVEAVLEYFKIPHTHQFIKFSEIKTHSPTGLVPILQVNTLNTTISDSLSICEFLAESHPELALWPRDRRLRALARTAASQMHSGFSVLRKTFPTNFLARYTGNVPIPEDAMAEIERMFGIWDAARLVTKKRLSELGEEDGGFLFGGFLLLMLSFGRFFGDSARMAFLWMLPVLMLWLGWRRCGIAHYDDIFRGREDIQYSLFPQEWTFSVTEK